MGKVALFLRNLTSSFKVTFVLQNFDQRSNKNDLRDKSLPHFVIENSIPNLSGERSMCS